MKPSVPLLIASLAANVALVVAVAFQSQLATASSSSRTPADAARNLPARSAPSTVAPVPPPLWSAFQTDNLDDFRSRLRAAGFPPKVIRMLLSQKISARTLADREALLGSREDIPYWRATYNGDVLPRDQQTRLNEIYRESRALAYKYVSGPDALAEDEEAQTLARRRYGNLPLEKLQQLTALQHDYEDLRMQAGQNTLSNPGDAQARAAAREAIGALDRENQAQLAKLLSPAELEQYDLRNNASYLASQLTAFQPTEDEFKSIYALQKSLRDVPSDPSVTPGQRQEEYEARLAAALGPERALDYLEIAKAGSDHLPLLISRLNLPLSTIGGINAVKTDISQRAQAVSTDSSLTAAQREAQLATLAQEASDKLTTTLGGKRGYDAYLDMKGDWIRSLQPKRK